MTQRLIETLADDPLAQLATWIREAESAGVKEPNAMALATSTRSGVPSVRIVLAKDVEADQVHFFTNYESQKAKDLLENPVAAAVFHWVSTARQVRVEGTVSKLSRAASETYFASRPRGSQLAAWASRQSRPLASYDELLEGLESVSSRFGPTQSVPCPPQWGGFALTARRVEFWLGMPSRLHDRVVYERSDARWGKTQLAP